MERKPPDLYQDSEYRMMHDVEFRSAVMLTVQLATQHGFTPGELKQIAFAASLYIEQRRLPDYVRLDKP